jgi:hypothetical protein
MQKTSFKSHAFCPSVNESGVFKFCHNTILMYETLANPKKPDNPKKEANPKIHRCMYIHTTKVRMYYNGVSEMFALLALCCIAFSQ